MLTGLRNFLEIIYNNWTTICVIIGLIIGLYQKARKLFKKNQENKLELDREELERQIEVAKKHIQEAMLKMITDAEEEYVQVKSAGKIKRSQVIKEIYEEFPILYKATNQDDIIKYIDELIDESLITLRGIIEKNGGELCMTKE